MFKYPATLICTLLFYIISNSQSPVLIEPIAQRSHYYPHVAPITPSQMLHLQLQIKNNFKLLDVGIKSIQASEHLRQVLFHFPLRSVSALADPGYYIVAANVAHHTSGLFDYHCGNRTYPRNNGTDFYLWPFAWHKMNTELVNVVAAADGVIVAKNDGQPDLNCVNSGSLPNYLTLLHSNGTTSLYFHLKKRSLTIKNIGDSVVAGEFLGVVGSSGNSSNPHLNFQVYTDTSLSQVLDPYAGNCNSTNGNNTMWDFQEPYKVPMLNAIATHGQIPVPYGCHDEEKTQFRSTFNPGDTIYLGCYYRDANSSVATNHSLIKPDGTLFKSWSSGNRDTGMFSYAVFEQVLPLDASVNGTWKYQAEYNGNKLVTTFTVNNIITSLPSIDGIYKMSVYPVPSNENVIININTTVPKKIKFILYDLNGKILKQTNPKFISGNVNLNLNLSGYASGTYFLNTIINNQNIINKILIVK